jgi:hypothetical protein
MAHANPVKIANMALSHIGVSTSIESFTEPSIEASQANLWYDFSREQALEAANWSFARKRQALTVHSDAPPSAIWAFRYQYPADSVCLRELENPAGPYADAVPFEIEISEDGTKSILTDLESAVMIYTFDQPLAEMFSSGFVEALSYLLAHHLAGPLTGNADIKKEMLSTYLGLIRIAAAQSSNEGVSRAPRDAESIRGR